MAGMAIAIPGGSNISKTGDTMGKIRRHRGKKQEKMAKKLIIWQKKQVSPPLPYLPKWGNAAPAFHGVVVSGLEVVVSGLVVVEPGLEVVEPGLGLLEVSDNNMMMIIVFSYCILHQKSMRQQF